jgi:hypothetical protein
MSISPEGSARQHAVPRDAEEAERVQHRKLAFASVSAHLGTQRRQLLAAHPQSALRRKSALTAGKVRAEQRVQFVHVFQPRPAPRESSHRCELLLRAAHRRRNSVSHLLACVCVPLHWHKLSRLPRRRDTLRLAVFFQLSDISICGLCLRLELRTRWAFGRSQLLKQLVTLVHLAR